MTKVLKDCDDITHLRGADSALCGIEIEDSAVYNGELMCPACAKIAFQIIDLSTKAERREWRRL